MNTAGSDARLVAILISVAIYVLLWHIGPDSRRDWSHCPPRAFGVDGVPVTN